MAEIDDIIEMDATVISDEEWESQPVITSTMQMVSEGIHAVESIELPPTVEEMIEENKRRMAELSDGFNPLTGYKSIGERRRVRIEDFPIKTQYLPVALLRDPFVKDLVRYGLKGMTQRLVYLHEMGDRASAVGDTSPADYSQIEVTSEEMNAVVEQFFRKRGFSDFPFWCWMYVKIHPKGSGEDIPFRLNRAQRRLIERFERMRTKGKPIRLILLKARQWGGSTATQIYMSWLQLMVLKGANSIIVGHVKDASTEVKDMLTKLLDSYKPEMVVDPNSPFYEDDVNEVKKNGLYHGSSSSANIFYIKSRNAKFKLGTAEKPNSARGGDSTLAHCTEVGLWMATDGRTPEDIVTSVTGGISYKPNTMIVYESTAKGTGNFFHRFYTAAKQAEVNGTFHQFERMFINWYEIGWKNMMPFKYDHEYLKQNVLIKASNGGRVMSVEEAQVSLPWFDFYLPDYIPEDAVTIEEFAENLIKYKDQTEAPDAFHEPGRYLWRLWKDGATLQGIYWYVCERTKYSDHGDMASETPSDDIEAFKHSGAKVFSEYHVEQFRDGCKPAKYVGDVIAEKLEWSPTGLRPNKSILKGLKFVDDPNGSLKIWQMPETFPDHRIKNRYLTVVDIGGVSNKADYSVVTVFDRYWMMDGKRPEVVAQWYGHIHHDLLAWKSAQIAKFYDNSLLVIESNTLETRDRERNVDGDASDFILNQIKECYTNLYERTADNENIIEGAPHKYGFHTNVKTKTTIILNLQHVVREHLYIERDERCLHEYNVYEKKQNGSYGAIVGEHDDLLMTRAIGMYICFCEMPLPRVIWPDAVRYIENTGPVSAAIF